MCKALPRRLALLMAFLLLCVASAAWAEPVARSITLNQTSLTLAPGGAFKLKATVDPEQDVSWESSDEAVATVSTSGRVRALAEGAAVVTATAADGQTAKCAVLVKDIPVASVRFDVATLAIAPGNTYRLKATVLPENAGDKTLTWTSSQSAVATVDQDGRIAAIQNGATVITARAASGAKAVCRVTVKDVKVKSITLNRTTVNIGIDKETRLIATILPATASDLSVTWKSSKPDVASVEDGLVVGHKEGSATITAIANGGNRKSAACRINVQAVRVDSIKLNKSSAVLDKQETLQLKATVLPNNATYTAVSWSSQDEKVATVDKNGLVTGVGKGTTNIVAKTDQGKKLAKCSVRVRSGNVKTLTVSAAGDVVLGGDPRNKGGAPQSYHRFSALLKEANNDYGWFFQNVKDIFANDDLTIVNLEGTLCTKTDARKKKFVFRGLPAYVNILKEGSIEFANLANNHTDDFRESGYLQTRRVLNNAGIGFAGQYEFKIKKVNGIKVGFYGYLIPPDAESVRKRIAEVRANCDLLIVTFHWGFVNEWTYQTTSRQKALAYAAVDGGADLVLGHHTHLVKGIEKYNGKYIVYDLANFATCILNPKDKDTYIFQQTFNVSDGYVEDGGIKVIPCSSTSDQSVNNCQPTPLTGADAERVLKKMRKLTAEYRYPAEF